MIAFKLFMHNLSATLDLDFIPAVIFQTGGNDLAGQSFGDQFLLDAVAPIPLALELMGIDVSVALIVQIVKA